MSKEYDQITAFHYSAYRPTLHSKILIDCFGENGEYSCGLDIGCGTGHSSIALSHYCSKVFGIDPSNEMLSKSLTHPRVEYGLFNPKNLDFENDYFDIITFAGSLYYAKSQQLLNETIRVSAYAGKIIVYDFEIYLEEILSKLDFERDLNHKSDYDHRANFSGLNQHNIKIDKELTKPYSVNLSISNLSHLVLSSKDNYCILTKFYGNKNIHRKVSQKLHSVLKAEIITVEAMTYLTTYSVVK